MTKKEKENLIIKIEKLKEDTREETGAFKYDFAYNEVINLIKNYKNIYENKKTTM